MKYIKFITVVLLGAVSGLDITFLPVLRDGLSYIDKIIRNSPEDSIAYNILLRVLDESIIDLMDKTIKYQGNMESHVNSNASGL